MRNLALILFVCIFGYVVLAKLDILPPVIDERTEVTDISMIVEKAKRSADLFSATYHTEILMDTTIIERGRFYNHKKRAVLIATGTCYASTDLTKLKVYQDTIKDLQHLVVPSAKIKSTVVNPSSFKIVDFDRGISVKEYKLIQQSAVKHITKDALKSKIIEKANQKTMDLLYGFMKSAGFKNVVIEIKEDLNSNQKHKTLF